MQFFIHNQWSFSYTRELLEVNHIKTIYNIFVALLVMFIINTVVYDYIDSGRWGVLFFIYLDLKHNKADINGNMMELNSVKRISLKKNPAQRHLSVAISIFFQARQGRGGEGWGACAQISNNSWRVVMTRLFDKRSCTLISSGSWRLKKIDLKCTAACYNITFPQCCAITKNTKWSILYIDIMVF